MRILCLPYTFTLSHISRPLAIASELRKRGHELIFAGDSPHAHFITDEGFDILPIYQLPPNILFERIRQGKLRFVLDVELKQMVSADRKLINDVQPDLLLTDGRFSAPISAGIENLQHTAIVNVSSTEYRALPYIPFFDRLPIMLKQNSRLKDTLDRINLSLEMMVFDNASRIFQKLNREYGLKNLVTATNCLTGKDLTLLADIPEYFPTRNLPESYHYIGPLTWKSTLPKPTWWPPKKNSKLVYFTMGTTWLGGSFQYLYDKIKQHKITAIISTGGQLINEQNAHLKTIPGEIYLEDFLDGDMALSASDVVVCHGGNGTIYQSLQQGKPIIGIPTIPDQKFNMRRVKDLGVGEMISLEEFEKSPDTLFQLIKKVSETPSYTECSLKMQKLLKMTNPVKKASDLIEELMTSKQHFS